MKRTILLFAIVCVSFVTAKAQLADTKWKGIIKIPMDDGTLSPQGVIFAFQKDTASVSYDNGSAPDVMLYWTKNNMISFKKVSGDVPCDTTALLTCSYEIKNDQLFLKRIQDACKARAAADASQPFDRIK